VATGVALGILMAIAIGGIEASTADLDSTATDTTSDATDTPSDVPTAVDGGIESTELQPRQIGSPSLTHGDWFWLDGRDSTCPSAVMRCPPAR
jgi:hypothetical protein